MLRYNYVVSLLGLQFNQCKWRKEYAPLPSPAYMQMLNPNT